MQYKYCEKGNFEDLSSGRVIMQRSGYTNFPVRLSQEIFCRCQSYLSEKQKLTVYDPCCGGGYLLSVLGFLNPTCISSLIGSDIDKKALQLSRDNLAILTDDGIRKRKNHLLSLYEQHHKQIYLHAAASADNLSKSVAKMNLKTCVFEADVFKYEYTDLDFRAHIIITDVPYGNLVSWHENESSSINSLLNNIRPILHKNCIIAICSDKSQKIQNLNYKLLEKQLIGKRKFEILMYYS